MIHVHIQAQLSTWVPSQNHAGTKVYDLLRTDVDYAEYCSLAGPSACKGIGNLLLTHCLEFPAGNNMSHHKKQFRLFSLSKSSKDAACVGLNAEIIWSCGCWSPNSAVKIWPNVDCEEGVLNLPPSRLNKVQPFIAKGLQLNPELETRLSCLPDVRYEDIVAAILNGVAIDMAYLRENEKGVTDNAPMNYQDRHLQHDGAGYGGVKSDGEGGFVVMERRSNVDRSPRRLSRGPQLYKALAELTLEVRLSCISSPSCIPQHFFK
jgi:hypothetical protein